MLDNICIFFCLIVSGIIISNVLMLNLNLNFIMICRLYWFGGIVKFFLVDNYLNNFFYSYFVIFF